MVDVADKLAYFQAITGLEDADLCTEILAAHGWDLEVAVGFFNGSNSDNSQPPRVSEATASGNGAGVSGQSDSQPSTVALRTAATPGLAWKLVTLPINVVSGSLGLISGAVGLGLWAAGSVLSYSLSMIGLDRGLRTESSSQLVSVSAATSEAADFVSEFEREYGPVQPIFYTEGFMEVLQRSRQAFKLMFVYLHSPDHPDTPSFCRSTLCSEAMVTFINQNFLSWGGNIRNIEGFKMSNSLKASRFPFCAVVMAATDQRIALLQQIEGPKSAVEMQAILQRVLEDSAPVLVAARVDAEERRNNLRLREEQDAAYRAALHADQERDRQRREEKERMEREAAEAERKHKEAEEAREARANMRQQKALFLCAEPDKGSDVTQVLIRFPAGERRARRFKNSATIQTVYDYVDSLNCLGDESYSLVSNFPRTVYGPEKSSMSLEEAGLHPQASLFVELKS